mgnify:CR=1 FL=1
MVLTEVKVVPLRKVVRFISAGRFGLKDLTRNLKFL